VDDDPVLLEVTGGVAVLSLNRPDDHNVMGDAVDALFFRYLDLLRTDRDVRVVVWRGNGPSFSAGRDMAELMGEDVPAFGAGGDLVGAGVGADTSAGNGIGDGVDAGGGPGGAAVTAGRATSGRNGGANGRSDDTGPNGRPVRAHAQRHGFGAADFEVLDRAQWGTRLFYDFPVPIICALKGWTLGTAFERALLCDLRVAGDDTKLALAGIDHGLVPDAGGVARLFEIGGSALALDLALTGRRIDAHAALRLGLVSQVVPSDDLDGVVMELARAIAARPPLVVRMVREQVQSLAAMGVRNTLGAGLIGQTMVLASHDFHEQHQARAEDREPRYTRR
jgi:enoyl-CoA hydratase/carnithine racemase